MGYKSEITMLPTQALFDFKGPQAALAKWAGADLPGFPAAPGTVARKAGLTLCFIGPDHWLLRAALDREAALERALRPTQAPPAISIVRISDTRAFFRITGADAGQIMAIGCPLDLHSAVFREDAVSFTEFFGLHALVMRCRGGFDCAVEQSYGPLLADYLARAVA